MGIAQQKCRTSSNQKFQTGCRDRPDRGSLAFRVSGSNPSMLAAFLRSQQHEHCQVLGLSSPSTRCGRGGGRVDRRKEISKIPPNRSLTFCDETVRVRPPGCHPDTVRVRRVAANIIAAAYEEEVVRGLNWRVHVIDADEGECAYCYESGEIVVFSWYLKRFCGSAGRTPI
uniref:Uncharacterized protein n=1 Tax=Oryza punctata TaxID=4537 RepID=A0A0E0K4Z7_ORYPU